jgi:hypothetical protein
MDQPATPLAAWRRKIIKATKAARDNAPTTAKALHLRSKRTWIVSGLLLVVLALAAFAWHMESMPPTHGSSAMPTNPAIEARWGVRVTQIGMTADGGMVDFRFVVLNPDPALNMMLDVNKLPVLVAEDNGTVLNSTAQMGDDHYLNVGQTYFLLFRNSGGAVQSGSYVTVRFVGNLELRHVLVQ